MEEFNRYFGEHTFHLLSKNEFIKIYYQITQDSYDWEVKTFNYFENSEEKNMTFDEAI